MCFAERRYADAVTGYRHALAVIEECYGKDTDYWRITADNLRQAEEAAAQAGVTVDNAGVAGDAGALPQSGSRLPNSPAQGKTGANAASSPSTVSVSTGSAGAAEAVSACPVSGLKLARAFWTQMGKPMIAAKYPQYAGVSPPVWWVMARNATDSMMRIRRTTISARASACGLRMRITRRSASNLRSITRHCRASSAWDAQGRVTFEAHARSDASGAFPSAGAGSPVTPRAQGANRRDGVFRIGDFFESITGYHTAPAQTAPHEWLMLQESTLAAATNGEVFADPTGLFSKTRQGFKNMPDDVRLALISKRLGMIAQAGQYNLPRSLKRGDGAAAWLSIHEFVQATASLVFLVNVPMVVGYMPYYKWQFAALRKLSGSMFALLPNVGEQLETVMRLSSAACYGGAGFGEGGKGAAPAIEKINDIVEQIAVDIVKELKREHLTTSGETFLEWQRPYVEDHIASDDPVLKSL